MNAGEKREGSGKSGLSRNKLFGAIEHVHNPFSMNSHRDHTTNNYRKDESTGNLRTMILHVEMTKAEAILMAQNLIARIQKS